MTKRIGSLFALTALLVSCGEAQAPEDTPREWPTVGAINAVADDDPLAEGQWRFQYDTWGVEILDGSWPPASFMLDLMESEPEVFGDQYARFGFVYDAGDDLPVGLKRGIDDDTRVTTTCALCHVATLPNGVWLGAPNTKLDFAGFRLAVDERWVASGGQSMVGELDREKLLRLGPGRTGAESGEFAQVVAVDFPPYFHLGSRARLNYLGTGRDLRSEAYLSIFSSGAGYPNPEEARVPFPSEERAGAFVAFLGQLESPPAPDQDAGLVARGAEVFQAADCGACHHLEENHLNPVVTVPTHEDAVELLPGVDPDFARGAILTSPLHRVLVDGDPEADPDEGDGGDPGVAIFLFFILDKGLVVVPTDGYRTADLRGVWATAPYLHNGSVPTLEALLTPAAERPVRWERDGFEIDTTLRENNNGGHEWGTDLPDADKAALIAYLLSL